MTNFDRYTIIKGLIHLVDKYETSIVNNALISAECKRELIQENNITIKDIIDRLLLGK